MGGYLGNQPANVPLTTSQLGTGIVTTPKIADLAVTTAKIADLAVTTAKIADLNVTSGKVSDLAVITAKIADLAVTTAKIQGLSVTTGKIADLNVTTGKIADLNVTTGKIANLAITGGKLETNIDLAGTLDVTGLLTADASVSVTGNVDILAQGDLRLQDSAGGQYVAMQAPATIGTSYTLTLPADDGDADQVLATDGSGVTSWVTSGGLYNAWLIKTSAYTALSGDQLICNSGSAFTITLPASPAAGDTVIIKNEGSGQVTVGRNGQNINSSASDAQLPNPNAAQLVYVDNTIGWTVI